jgi:acyl-[acyl-carrier-protein]-phospholipid O-acyltransferase/long-chain-fatty-acid--[acyl-carrier-protein] ligase
MVPRPAYLRYYTSMLQHRFIDSALRNPDKIAFIDRSLGSNVSYSRALLASLILARRFKKLERGRIGVMLPTSSAGGLAVIAALMADRTPVMINYSTGAEKNCLYAKEQCDFRVIVTAKALLEKIGCKKLPNMVLIEDILGTLGKLEKALAFVKSNLPTSLLKRAVGKSNPDSPAVILFTSGSEKEPKVVQLTQRNILSNIDSFSEMMDIYEMDNLLAVLPYFHVFGSNLRQSRRLLERTNQNFW